MNEKAYSYMDWPRIEAIVYAEEASPKDVMSPRLTPDGILIQGFFPGAEEAAVLVGNKEYPMEQEDEAGYFAAMIPGRKIPAYQFRVKTGGKTEVFYDAYAFPGMLTEEDEKAFVAGVYYNAYEKLGAHPVIKDGIEGTSFAVWAPNAARVSVVGDFNHWDGRRLPMHRMPMSGIFELFVPGVQPGDIYKYEILVKGKGTHLKADPYANRAEQPRACGSVVAKVDDFVWNDQAWMADRKKYADRDQPVSIYETSLTKWKTAGELVDFVSDLGYTHVELHPVMEYMEDQTDGYSTSSYFAPTSRFGTTDYDKGAALIREKYNIPLVCITLGKEGSRVYYKDLRVEVAPFLQENTIETTGAGDTFCASMLNYVLDHGLTDLTEENLTEMLTFANGAASLITTKKGALRVMPSREEVLEFIASSGR